MGDVVNQILDTCIYTPVPVLPERSRTRKVPLETLKAMARAEDKARHAPGFQELFKERYAAERRGEVEPVSLAADIIDSMQRDVLEAHGFKRDDELTLYELRTAAMQYPAEPEFQNSTFIKYNRCGDCPIQDGDALADTELCDPLALQEMTLSALVKGMADPTAEQIAASKQGAVIPARLMTEEEAAAVDPSPLVVVTGSYT